MRPSIFASTNKFKRNVGLNCTWSFLKVARSVANLSSCRRRSNSLLDNFDVVGSAIPALRISSFHQRCPRSIAGGRLVLWGCSSVGCWCAVAEKTFTSIVVWKRVPDMCVHVAVQVSQCSLHWNRVFDTRVKNGRL